MTRTQTGVLGTPASLIAVVAALALTLAACGEAEETASPAGSPAEDTSGASPATSPAEPTEPTSPAGEAEMTLALEPVAEGLTSPLWLLPAPGDEDRLFVVDQAGQIRVIDNGELVEEPFLDVTDRMVELMEEFDERGLLGLAFHPEYAQNGRFFVYYSAPLRDGAPDNFNHTATISEFTVTEDDPLRADPDSERVILEVDQPQFNHNGGTLAFGPDDGYLYISLGDGGGGNDVGVGHNEEIGNGQDRTNVLGAILRIDVDGEEPYAIPDDNPFADEGEAAPEIYAYGFRNPYRMSFDSAGDNELFVGDAGQERIEEVSIVTRGGNYGWFIKEGTECFDAENPETPPEECADEGPFGEPLIDPVIEYQNTKQGGDGIGLVVVGGFVYRGSAMPELEGSYVFGDWSASFEEPSGTILVASPPDGDGMWPVTETGISGQDGLDGFVLGFGQDADGELYVLTSESTGPTGDTGQVRRIVPADG